MHRGKGRAVWLGLGLATLHAGAIALHDADIVHALKEVDGAASGWAKTPEQVVEILKYTLKD